MPRLDGKAGWAFSVSSMPLTVNTQSSIMVCKSGYPESPKETLGSNSNSRTSENYVHLKGGRKTYMLYV